MRLFSPSFRLAVTSLAVGLGVLALTPSMANAYWVQPGVVVAAPPLVVAPPPPVVVVPRPRIVPAPRVVYAPYPYAHWVRPHYNRFGRFIPGHWD